MDPPRALTPSVDAQPRRSLGVPLSPKTRSVSTGATPKSPSGRHRAGRFPSHPGGGAAGARSRAPVAPAPVPVQRAAPPAARMRSPRNRRSSDSGSTKGRARPSGLSVPATAAELKQRSAPTARVKRGSGSVRDAPRSPGARPGSGKGPRLLTSPPTSPQNKGSPKAGGKPMRMPLASPASLQADGRVASPVGRAHTGTTADTVPATLGTPVSRNGSPGGSPAGPRGALRVRVAADTPALSPSGAGRPVVSPSPRGLGSGSGFSAGPSPMRKRRSTCRSFGGERVSSPLASPGPDPLRPTVGLFGEEGSTWRRRSLAIFMTTPRAGSPREEREPSGSPSELSCTRRRAGGQMVVLPEILPETEQERAFAQMVDSVEIPWEEAGTATPASSRAGSPAFRQRTQRAGLRMAAERASPVAAAPPPAGVNWARRATLPQSPSGRVSSHDGVDSPQQPLHAPSSPLHAVPGEAASSEEDESDPESPAAARPKWACKLQRPGFAPPPAADEDADAVLAEVIHDEHPEVDFGELRLKTVPPSLFTTCPHIVALDLYGNQLEKLPEAICSLRFLQRLSAKSNRIAALPAALGDLRELTHLYLDQNMLETLPDSCCALSKLEVVGLDWNDLVCFPDCLCDIAGLQQLFIQENPRLDALPPAERAAGFEHLQLHLDNSPALVEQAGAYCGTSKVEFQWNKIFPDKVLDFLYLGSLRSAQEPRVYAALGITHVASIGRELSVVLAQGMEQLQLNVDDLSDTDLSPLFGKVHAFIDEARAAGGACLVHCFKGQSRSATMVCTYLMSTRGMRRDDAIAFVRERRPMINPNPGFMRLMALYEVTLGLRPPEPGDGSADAGGV
eukprot:TRINITY_DN1546_c0_g2_i1.p1 TRINITY_DN1546_c0_g2~~TRINITY_DN1546_c0_g2_i1.p1  ORF type:complete len:880 (+),score=213.28 TRINITY_DN1546_c0_g2_i1:98-2641(+)